MKKQSPTRRWISLTIIAMLFLSPSFLQGCDGLMGSSDPDSIIDFSPQEKFRHADLLDRAKKKGVAGKSGTETLNLIFSVDPLKVLDRYKILDRFKVLDRYRILDRYEYKDVFSGFAISVEDLEGLADYNELLDLFEGDPDIIWYEPDFSVSTPTGSAASAKSGQRVPWSVAAIGGQNSWAVSGDGQGYVDVDVFILDTGVAQANVKDESSDLVLVENIDFRDLQLQDAKDIDGHGTHIAGIIGAVDDTDGLVGIAPGARIHNFKVLNDNGSTDVSVVIAAVEHILALKQANPSTPMVVNMSLGEDIGTENHTALDQAIEVATDAGIVFVAAAGNHGKTASKITPAHVKDVITVGSYNVNGVFSPFSNFGPKVDILAPGEAILSMAPDGTVVSMSGTSMATAHVTGAVALYLAQNPTATASEVHTMLQENAKDIVVGAPSSTTNKSVWVGVTTHQEELRIMSGNDDAEEKLGRHNRSRVFLSYEDIYLGATSGWYTGLRFTGAGIPQGATITNAYIQFTTNSTSTNSTSLTIKGEASDNAVSFASTSRNIINRSTTSESVAWNPSSWNLADEAGAAQQTPDIKSIVQALVNRSGWTSDSPVGIIINGSGDSRIAWAYEGDANKSAVLHVEWQ